MSIKGYTDEDLADMTPTEIQALKDFEAEDGGEPGADDNDKEQGDDHADDDAQAKTAVADAPGADDGAVAAADPDAAAAGVDAPAESAATGAAADEPGKPAGTPVQTAPIYVAEAPADAEEKFADIRKQVLDARLKYEAGELTFDEYEDTKDTLAEERAAIQRQIDRAQISQEMARQQWLAEGERFAADNGYAVGSRHYKMLDLELVAVSADPANAHFTSPMQYLQLAHANLAAEGFAPKGKATPAAPAAAAKARVEIPKPTLPPNLAFTPAADASDVKNGQWAHIDNISDPDAREAAVMKLTDAQRDAYLMAQ